MIRCENINGTGDIGDPLWLDDSTLGKPTLDKPTTAGKVVRSLGYWIGGTTSEPIILFDPSSTYILLS